MKPIKTSIERVGQPYVDDPVYERLNPIEIANAVRVALGMRKVPPLQLLVAYQHTKLNWIRP